MLIFLLYVPLVVFAEYGRLSKSVLPTQYNLSLTFYFDGYGYEASSDRKDTFDGIVSILLNITEPVDRIVLHSKNLNFTKEDCYVNSLGRMKNISRIEEDSENEQILFIFNETLPVSFQEGILHIKYSGIITQDNVGIYKSTYFNRNGNETPIISTQFEPTFAHRLVPCFDEPWMKAIWNIDITHPVGSRALSNMAEKHVRASSEDHMKTTTFFPTPVMSSYLLALTISDFEYISNYSESGTLVRVFAPSYKLGETKIAMEAALESLTYFEKKFGINYPLSKLDLFPINKFVADAMENWGLIIFKTERLLGVVKQEIKPTVAHEIAHQWFGNLVTMDWYSDLWLNEGLATNYQTLDPMKRDFIQMLWYGMYHDSSLRNENPTKKRRMNKEDLQMDPATTHGKSSSIVLLLYKVIGPEQFEKGVSAYLKDNMYKSVNSTIFYSYLADLMPPGSPSISEFMDSWLEQVGLPLVVVEHFNETHYELTQERYDNGVLDSLDERLSTPKWNYSWNIPVWDERDGKNVLVWLKPGKKLIISNRTVLDNWFYKVKYAKIPRNIRIFYFLQYCKFTSLGIETFANLAKLIESYKPYIHSSLKRIIIEPLVKQLHPETLKMSHLLNISTNVSRRAMDEYEAMKNEAHLLGQLRNREVLVNSTFIINNFATLSENEDLLFEVAKQSEGVGKMTIKALCRNHPKNSLRIVLKQLEILEEWRRKHEKDVMKIYNLIHN